MLKIGFFNTLFYIFHTKPNKKKQRKALSLHAKIIEMFKTLLFTLLIIAISIVLLSVTVIIKKNGKFPNTHVGGNKAMRKRGIKCVQSQDKDARRKNHMAVRENR